MEVLWKGGDGAGNGRRGRPKSSRGGDTGLRRVSRMYTGTESNGVTGL